MTTAAINKHGQVSRFGPSNYGQSDLAQLLRERADEAYREFSKPFVNKGPLDLVWESLVEVYANCSSPDWDGYGAAAIDYKAVHSAMQFMYMLDGCVPYAEVTPEPDGEVALEWYGEGNSVFSVSFGAGELMTYAGRFADGTKTQGIERISQESAGLFRKYIARVSE